MKERRRDIEKLLGYSPHLAWCPSPMRWGRSSRPEAAAKPEESYRVQSSKQRWQKAEEREKKTKTISKSNNTKVRAQGVNIQDPRVTPARKTPENVRRPCARLETMHLNAFICRIITTVEQSVEMRAGFNKATGLVSVSLGSTPWPSRPSGPPAEEEDDEEDEYEPSEPLSSMPIIPEAAARQRWPFHTPPQAAASDLTHPTPPVPNPVTPARIPSPLPQKTRMPHL